MQTCGALGRVRYVEVMWVGEQMGNESSRVSHCTTNDGKTDI